MADDHQADIKRRFNLNFGTNRLPMFASCIRDLEKNGHTKTADVLKAMLKEELAGPGSRRGGKGS
jgi:hypothetical protein